MTPYHTETRTEMHPVNGILRPVEVQHQALDPVSEEIEALAKKLYGVTHKFRGGLMVPFHAQPDKIREWHHEMARVAIDYASISASPSTP